MPKLVDRSKYAYIRPGGRNERICPNWLARPSFDQDTENWRTNTSQYLITVVARGTRPPGGYQIVSPRSLNAVEANVSAATLTRTAL